MVAFLFLLFFNVVYYTGTYLYLASLMGLLVFPFFSLIYLRDFKPPTTSPERTCLFTCVGRKIVERTRQARRGNASSAGKPRTRLPCAHCCACIHSHVCAACMCAKCIPIFIRKKSGKDARGKGRENAISVPKKNKSSPRYWLFVLVMLIPSFVHTNHTL